MTTHSRRQQFAATIDAERRRQHLSVRDIARLAGVPATTAYGWLSGRHFPVPALRQNYLRIVDHLNLTDQLPDGLWDESWLEAPRKLGSAQNPYLGLQPFGAADRDRFFGRSRESRRLAEAVLERRRLDGSGVVVVLGASGSGKSSLLAAGLLATEAVDGLLAGWPVAQLTVADLSAGARPTVDLVVIDQAEELFDLDEDSSPAAMTALAELAMRTVLVLAIRADAFAAATQVPVLSHAIT